MGGSQPPRQTDLDVGPKLKDIGGDQRPNDFEQSLDLPHLGLLRILPTFSHQQDDEQQQ